MCIIKIELWIEELNSYVDFQREMDLDVCPEENWLWLKFKLDSGLFLDSRTIRAVHFNEKINKFELIYRYLFKVRTGDPETTLLHLKRLLKVVKKKGFKPVEEHTLICFEHWLNEV